MGAVPAKCLQCKSDLRYDLANLRYRCPRCEAGEIRTSSEVPAAAVPGATGAAGGPSTDPWRERGEAVGREAARLLHRVQRWLGK